MGELAILGSPRIAFPNHVGGLAVRGGRLRLASRDAKIRQRALPLCGPFGHWLCVGKNRCSADAGVALKRRAIYMAEKRITILIAIGAAIVIIVLLGLVLTLLPGLSFLARR